MVVETGETVSADLGARRGGMVRDLAGISGRVGVEVDGKPIGELVVDDGHVELAGETAPAEGAIAFRSAEDLWKVLRGELNPIVASLQGRMSIRGDLTFVARIILSIAAASPFAAAKAKGG
jgi:putative sterol carrier protein